MYEYAPLTSYLSKNNNDNSPQASPETYLLADSSSQNVDNFDLSL